MPRPVTQEIGTVERRTVGELPCAAWQARVYREVQLTVFVSRSVRPCLAWLRAIAPMTDEVASATVEWLTQ